MLTLDQRGAELLNITAPAGEKLSEAIWLSGLAPPRPLCGGLGLCGRCRIKFISSPPPPAPEDQKYFSEADLSQGWRLACHHIVPASGSVQLELPRQQNPYRNSISAAPTQNTAAALGIDLGTTSIQWAAVPPDSPEQILASGTFLNPQAGAGADIVSRIAHALRKEGFRRLSHLAASAIFDLASELEAAGYLLKNICIAANSAMTEILLEKDIAGLAHAPYYLAFTGNETVRIELDGKSLSVLIPPLPAPFAGGDISAGILALIKKSAPRPFLLADLGTNAEIALLDCEDNLYLASVPLGPALEGIGPACGQSAGPGVITGFTLTPGGISACHYQNVAPEKATGISASGYLSLLAILLRTGAMDGEGQFVTCPAAPLGRKIMADLKDNRLTLTDGLYLTAGDIELLLKVRAAFRITLEKVLRAANLGPDAVASLWLAGALGESCSLDDLITTGFLPRTLADRTHLAGNTALQGACLLAAAPENCSCLAGLCSRAHILQMADDPDFLEEYISAMRWEEYGA